MRPHSQRPRLAPCGFVPWLVAACVGLSGASCDSGSAAGPAMILTGGSVYRSPRAGDTVSAMAIQDESILALGTDQEMLSLAGEDTQVMPMDGAVVLPGLHDGWVDLLAAGAIEDRLDLRLTASRRDVQAKLRAAAATTNAPVIVGWGWDERHWPDAALPAASVLDAAVSDRPVVLYRHAGRVAWLNSLAIERAGVSGREMRRDGTATGLVAGVDLGDVETALLPPSDEGDRDRIRRALQQAAAAGITSLASGPLPQHVVDVLASMEPEDITLRLEARMAPGATAPAAHAAAQFASYGIDLDGPTPLYQAAMADPYSDGHPTVPVDATRLEGACAAAAAAGLPLDVQARGDGAIAAALRCSATRFIVGADVMPAVPPGPAPRILVVPGRLEAELYWLDSLLGPLRVGRTHPYRDLARRGWLAGFASDAPDYRQAPLEAVRTMLTRRDAEGFPLDSWQGQERLSIGDSLRIMMAAGPLPAELSAGRDADFVVWSADPFAGPEQLRAARAMIVFVRGRVVYSRPLVTPPMDRRQRP